MKISGLVALTLASGASAFSPAILQQRMSTAVFNGHIGAGGMADTRDPNALVHEDARKSIGVAPSFEEYMKARSGGGDAAAAPAPAAAAPAPVAAAPAPVAAAPAKWSPAGSGAKAPWSPTPAAPAAAAPAAYSAPAAAAPAAAAPAGGHIGAGGMADTRDPDSLVHEDARKSIGVAPSFEEYMKARSGGAPAAPAPVAAAPAAYGAPAAAAPAAAVGGGGGVLDTLSTLEGPGQVWGADGIAVGKEESDFKEFDNFNLFFDRLQASGVAAELAGAGPFTVFAPVNSAIETYEMMKGPVDAAVCRFNVVPGNVIASSDVSGADLTTLTGSPLTYRYAVRKHFVNDAIIGEKTFGPFSDYPVDVSCGNGVVHGVGLVMA